MPSPEVVDAAASNRTEAEVRRDRTLAVVIDQQRQELVDLGVDPVVARQAAEAVLKSVIQARQYPALGKLFGGV
jgi:hypothetical protein